MSSIECHLFSFDADCLAFSFMKLKELHSELIGIAGYITLISLFVSWISQPYTSFGSSTTYELWINVQARQDVKVQRQ